MVTRLKSILLALSLSLALWLGWPAIMAPAQAAEAPTPELQALYKDLDALYEKAFIATDKGDFVTAEGLWGEAIERMPTNPATWSNRGNARVSQFKLEAAIADFDKAVELAPNQPGPYVNRGTAWEGLKEWDRAIADYNKGIELDPEDPVAFNNRGNAEGGKGNWQEALDDFYHSAELARGFALPNMNYALTLYQMGDKAEGTRKIRNLVRRYSQAADPRAALTAVLWDQGLGGEAESNWAAAVNLDNRYKDVAWVRDIRRWPPALVDALDRFLRLDSKATS